MAKWTELSGLKVTVMGLGLNGGGVESARFFASRGAKVTVTDLRDETVLAPSLEKLAGVDLRFVLGRHEPSDFARADLVVRNPAVRDDNPYLSLAKKIETDISIFLQENTNPLLAVTGSKGKSTTCSALHFILKSLYPETRLGGNITVSPLSFLDQLDGKSPVVLELSSWQLRDLRGRGVLRPRVAAITNILHDHLNSYGGSMEAYADDKREVFRGQGESEWTVCNLDQSWGAGFAAATRARVAAISARGRPQAPEAGARSWLDHEGGWFEMGGWAERLLPDELRVPGDAFRFNSLIAGTMARLFGLDSAEIRARLADFAGVEHRLERCADCEGIVFYNDSAATIPEAAAASFSSFTGPVHWIAGGTDKDISLQAYSELSTPPASLTLLAGSATERLIPLLESKGWSWHGPFRDFRQAVHETCGRARAGEIVLLSPGAASFEMFKNEFDRGNQFKALVREWISAQS